MIRDHAGLVRLSVLASRPWADRQVQLLGAAGAFGHVGELGGEASPAGDLEQQVGQVHPRQQRGDLLTQGEQACRLVEAVQWGEHRPVPALDGLHLHCGVTGQSGGDRAVSGVEAKAAADLVAGGIPGLAGEQPGAGVGPPRAGGAEDVSAAQRVPKPLEHTQKV